MIVLTVNGNTYEANVEPDTPLLWVLRDTIGLTGTKYGCGIAQCGACTVQVDGVAMRSCALPAATVVGRRITTIEGLAEDGVLHRCSRPGLTMTCRNAATVSPA
jgi:isoquinoline 1-oxidoreductase alpha subunit